MAFLREAATDRHARHEAAAQLGVDQECPAALIHPLQQLLGCLVARALRSNGGSSQRRFTRCRRLA